VKYTKEAYESPVYHNGLILKFKYDDRLTVQKTTYDYRDGLLSTKRDLFDLSGTIKVDENVPPIEADSAKYINVHWN